MGTHGNIAGPSAAHGLPSPGGCGYAFPLPAGIALPLTLRQKLSWIPGALRSLALALLGFAAAGPHWGAVRTSDETRGIAIELLVDRSSSMSLNDMRDNQAAESQAASRLDAVKRIAKEFLNGNGADLHGRPGDAVGLIAFAAHPENLSPMVSHNEERLSHDIDRIEIAQGSEDGTAIGDAISLAASRMRLAEQTRSTSFRSKVIVLLTDGQENGGTRRWPEAAQLAARWNIRVYAIGIRPSPDAEHDETAEYSLDALAAATNGMSVIATDTASLRQFFATIDRLEPNTIPSTGLRGGFDATLPALLLALAAVCSEILLRETWMRTVP
ncbi:MAG TPA: VWA domain-containing protein [Bryobacteraceae bacterium]|nr:VWA domain-containing protein [Bryobacteraceae bacterium]